MRSADQKNKSGFIQGSRKNNLESQTNQKTNEKTWNIQPGEQKNIKTKIKLGTGPGGKAGRAGGCMFLNWFLKEIKGFSRFPIENLVFPKETE